MANAGARKELAKGLAKWMGGWLANAAIAPGADKPAGVVIDALWGLFGGPKQETIESAAAGIIEEVAASMSQCGVGADRLEPILSNLQIVLTKFGPSAERLYALDLNSEEAVKEARNKAARFIGQIGRSVGGLVDSSLEPFYAALVKNRTVLAELQWAFQAEVLKRFTELSAKSDDFPAEAAAALRRVLAGSLAHMPQRMTFSGVDQFSSSVLLGVDFRVVDFVERATTQVVAEWCAKGPPISVALFTGPGGIGKTRLFIEMCERLRQDWSSGFLVPLPARGWSDWARRELCSSDRPLFLVLDYAETRHAEIAPLLEAALAADRGGTKLRLALISRGAGDWWDELKRTAPNAVRGLLEATAHTPITVTPLDE
ncbi:MAG: hypothetical protein HY246_11145, partial [Proteobacteria bacterium]|nr:hypothetical protein [Pseudomonadota bacterium]